MYLKIKTNLFLLLIIVQAGCVNLPLVRQNISLIPRNISLWNEVVEVNKSLIEKDLLVGILVKPGEKDVSPFYFIGGSKSNIYREEYFGELSLNSNDVCIVLYRYDVALSPETGLCYDSAYLTLAVDDNAASIKANAEKIGTLESKLASLEKIVENNTEKIDLGAEATIQIFRTAATNSNVLTAQNEFFDSVRISVAATDSKIAQINSRFSGFQSSILQQMQALNVDVVSLRAAILNLVSR